MKSLSDIPNAVYVYHGENVRLTCDEGYIVNGTLSRSDVLVCNRSNPEIPQGSFGPTSEAMECVGMCELNKK